eukprot:15341063-Ditylum_brightwellii.AAC.3
MQLKESVDSALQALQEVGDDELKHLSLSFQNDSIDKAVGKTDQRMIHGSKIYHPMTMIFYGKWKSQ